MGILGRGLVAAAHLRGLQLDRLDTRIAQERILMHLLRRSADTAFGQAHRFARIRGVQDFRERVPIARYEDVEPWIRRAYEGEPDVIWPGPIRYFAKSSGTSGSDKLLPITADAVRQQRKGGFDPVASYLRWTGDDSLLDGRAILLGGCSELERGPGEALVGVNTGVMANHIPWFVQHIYRPSPAVRAIHDWDEKIDRLVDETIDDDVRLIAGTPSWFPGLFDRLLEVARSRGRRAETVLDVWPNLRLMTGGGIPFEPYRALLEARLGGAVPYVDVYNSTEAGVMAVQDRADDRGMRLLPDAGTFYEFVPLEEIDSPNPTRLSLHELEPGMTAAVVVSTVNGLFAYFIGDTLRCVEANPHRFLFEGRTAAFLNVHGEKVSQRQLELAIREAADEVPIAEFTVSSELGPEGRPQHVWWIEPASDQSLDAERVAQRIDRALQRMNGPYARRRVGGHGLRSPRVRLLPPGTFQSWMRERGRLGGQNKVPRVVTDPEDQARLGHLAEGAVAK